MEGYSGMGGSVGITPATERIWAVQKKGKTEDHRRRQGKRKDFGKEGKQEEAVKGAEATKDSAFRHDEGTPDGDEAIGYGSGKSIVSKSRKIDLII